MVEWQTAAEIETVGFDLYRLGAGGAWVPVNGDVVPALNSIAGGTYGTPDPGASAPGTYTYKLVEWTLTGQENLAGIYTLVIDSPVRLTVCAPEGQQLRLAWEGGVPPYRLEKRVSLTPAGPAKLAADGDGWVEVPLADPAATSAVVPRTDANAFFRVRSGP